MPSDRINRHFARKQKLENLHKISKEIDPLIAFKAIDEICEDSHKTRDVLSEFEEHQQREMESFSAPINVSVEEVEVLLMDIRSRWDTNQMNRLIGDCRNSVLRSIVGPFGLGSVVATMDKNGGNVTTVHNAKRNVYARTQDNYNDKAYKGTAYVNARNQYKDGKIIENSQMIQDEYSGELRDYSQVDCDHIKPTKQYHQEGGFMQSKETKEAFGSDPNNFAMTDSSGNRSLGDRDKKTWQEKPSTNGSGDTNKDRFGHDNRRVNAAIERGQRTVEKYAPSTIYKGVYYGERAVITGVPEAGKMGLQQSLGLLLSEFFSAAFDEIADSYKNGFRDSLKSKGFFDALKIRLGRIAERVIARFKDAWTAFKEGTISGFLSNLITMLINMLVTTGKRIVRVIREGFMSILKAIKMALFPPEGMTRAEAADAALKLLATGVAVTMGILSEEAVEKSVTAFFTANMPPLAPYASMISSVFVGAVTGIVSAVLVYGLDKLDVFGVNRERQHIFVIQELDNLIAENDQFISGISPNGN